MWHRSVTAVLATLLAGCASLPSLEGRTPTTALAATDGTQLGRLVAARAAANPSKTGIHPLPDGRDAFAARVLLANAAEKSLDLQYYIWHGDQIGYLLFEAVWRAAQRGVRVRLLLDDGGTSGLDDTLAALDAHANIEVRLYNPFPVRGARGINFLSDFSRLNHRMHNKSFTADNQVAIVGGRNVGNEYYAAGGGVWFQDLDVIAVGAAVREVSKAFDLYWNSESAYPAASLVGAPAPDAAQALAAKFAATRADPVSASYIEAIRVTPLARQIAAGELQAEWATARVLRDDPAKTLDTTGRTDVLLLSSLLDAVGSPERSFDLVSPYFVPGKKGTQSLAALARSGTRLRVLTNSYAATDVSVVHSGYAKRRKDLLAAGVVMYELKPDVAMRGREQERSMSGSSSGSLHAKTFAIDGRRLFVGSFNFDERSARLNTEMGLLIDSPRLAAQLVHAFETTIPAGAYQVRLTADGDLEWIERTPAGEKVYASEPGMGLLMRGWVGFLSLLAIDWML
ncbi:MAG: phospholipase D family protein [Betaproteobacteria bacterium]|nr:phospholipase D family protein [Betaproteobacteria bacterium]MDH5350483.1 phospholipase D family protein [Betaproteobacteria bacterium]